MKIVFFGTPDYSLPILETLSKTFRERNGELPISAVVTQEPKPSGRSQRLEYSKIDSWAHDRKIPIFYSPAQIIKERIPGDIGVLASFGKIIPEEVINYFPHKILNFHPSLLPKFRGASPVQATIASGDKETGGTIIIIDKDLDHGKIVSQFKDEILEDDTTDSLRKRLFLRAADVIAQLIPAYTQGKIRLKEQDHEKATFTKQLKKEYGFVPAEIIQKTILGKSLKEDWQIPFIKDFSLKPTPETLDRFIKAVNPWPNAWTFVGVNSKKLRLKILKSHLEAPELKPNNSRVILDEVQLEGKTPVTWKQFKEGYPKFSFED